MEEIYKEIKGFEGKYWVSNLGNVKSTKKLLTPMFGRTQPYCKFALSIARRKSKFVMGHRLVAEHFLDNPNNFKVVHHKDHNPRNNRVDNLEWCTHSQNVKYAIDAGRFLQGFKPDDTNPSKKLTEYQVEGIRRLGDLGWSVTEISDLVLCSRGHISEILNNKKCIRN